MIAPLCNSKTAFLPVDQVKRPEKAVFVFEKVLMFEKLHLFGFLNFAHQNRDLTPKTSVQWILPGAIVGQASRLRSKDLRSQLSARTTFQKYQMVKILV
jgi:hypothetical protein